MASGMIVHGIPGSPYVRAALLTLEEKGAAYELAAMAFGTLKQQPHLALAFNEELHDRGDDSANPEFLAIQESDQARIRQALEELPAPLREVIILRELEGLSYQEIARVTESPVGTVMSRLSRGRRQLQGQLAASEGGEAI